MKVEKLVLVCIGICLFTVPSMAQRYLYNQPKIMAGVDAAYFRISFDEFQEVYDNKWGASYGGFVGYNVYHSYYAVAKVGTFNKNGKEGVHKHTGLDTKDAKWQEKWLQVGVRLHPPILEKWNSYYGFGVSFFNVKEEKNLSVLQTESGQDSHEREWGSGFYLELGVEYFVVPRMCIYGAGEISSGGIRGNAGFEAMSVGGYRFAAGIAIYPF